MKERHEFAIMLLITCFVGSSFWPILCGWVDISTPEGWYELVIGFVSLAATLGVFALIGMLAYLCSELVRVCYVFVFEGLRGGIYQRLNALWVWCWWITVGSKRRRLALVHSSGQAHRQPRRR